MKFHLNHIHASLGISSLLGCWMATVVDATGSGTKLGLCQVDCDVDSDCQPGLWCADAHKPALTDAGYDSRKVTCGNVGEWNEEVCFDPKLIQPKGNGGGDPHFSTFDGTKYSFHGQCDLVMVRCSEIGSTGVGMSLHARTEITTAGWSLISNAAVQIGNDDIFEITNDGTHFWNGIPNADLSQKKMAQRFPIATWQKAVNITKPDGEVLNTIRSTFKIYLGNDDNIEFIVFKNLIFVRVNAILQDSEGMLGIQGTVGMIGRDGNTILSDPIAMGMEWQVTDTEPILFREVRAPQYPEQCMLPKVDSRRLRGVSEEQRRLAEMACEGVPQEFQDFCRDDVLLTGDVTIVHGYAEAF